MTSIKRALVLSFIQRYLGFAITVVSTMVLARLLTPAQVGVYALASAAFSFAQTIRDFGVSEYLVQERELTRERLRTAFTLTLLTAWTAGLLIFSIRGVLADFYHEPGLRQTLAILCLNFVAIPFGAPAFAVMTREMAFGRILLIQTLSNLCNATCAISLAWAGWGYYSLAWAAVAGTVSQVLLVAILRPADTLVIPGLHEWRKISSFGVAITAANLLNDAVGRIYDFLIPHRFGFQALGLFSRANGFYNQFNDLVTAAVLRVALPAFAAKHRNGEDLRAAYDKTLAIYAVIAWSSFGVAGVLMPEVIQLLFGSQWGDAVPLARIAVVGALLYPLFAFSPALLTAIGHARKRVVVQLVLAPLVVATAFLTSLISLEAMLFGGLFCALVAAALYGFFLRKLMGYGARRLFNATAASAIVAGTSTLCCAIAIVPFDELRGHTLATLAWGGLWALAGWLVAVMRTRHPICEYIHMVFGRLGALISSARGGP